MDVELPDAHLSGSGDAERRQTRAAVIGFTVLAALFYAPLLLGLRTFPDGDFTYHFLPFSLFLRDELLAGRLPLWNPYTYAGHPFLADIQAAVFYPVSNVLLLFTFPWSSAADRLYWLQAEAALHLALGGFFTFLLVRELTGRPEAAFLAGAAFAFSGYLTGYPPLQLAVLRTAVWLPLVLWLVWRAFARPGRLGRWAGASTAFACSFLAGHPQTFFLLSQVVVAWSVFLLLTTWRREPGLQALTRRLAGVALFFLLALALSAAQLWPSLEFTLLSVRANVDYAFLSGGFPLQDTWQLLLPGVFTLFSPLYVGVVALGLALVAVACLLFRWEGEGAPAFPQMVPPGAVVVFFLGVTLLALLVSYGGNGFLYPLFYRWVPGWRLFRGQERAAYLVVFGLCVLAGYGAALLPTLTARFRRLALGSFVALVATGIALFGVFWQLPARTAIGGEEFLRIAAVVFLLAVLFAVIGGRKSLTYRHLLLLIPLVLTDLFLANFTTNLAEGGPARRVAVSPEVLALQAAVAERSGASQGVPARVYNEYRVYEDYGMQARVEDVWGSSPLRLSRYDALFQEFPLDRMWRLVGVEHVLTWRRELFGPSTLLGEYPQENDVTYLHRLPEPNPRAWVANTISVVDDGEAARLLADHEVDLDTVVVVPADAGLSAGRLAPPGRNDVTLERLAPSRLRARVSSEHGGILVVSENWMPGWRAFDVGVDGRKTELALFRANLTFLGLRVPAGERTIELVYWPSSVRNGLFISGATLILLVAGWLRWRRRHGPEDTRHVS